MPPRRRRLLGSILIIGHLAAVFLPPLAFQTRGPFGPSPSVSALMRPFLGYSQFFYLDRGYAFFAPDPGPSHLLRIGWRDDQQSVTETLPDLDDQWPRLRYHRRFMLAEFYHDQFRRPVDRQLAGRPLQDLPPEGRDQLLSQRDRFEAIDASIRRHAARRHSGEVTIERLEHLLPDFIPFAREPILLSDPRLFVNLDDPTPSGVDGPVQSIPAPEAEPVRTEP